MFTAISNALHPLFRRISADQFSREGFIKYFRNIQWTTISRMSMMVLSLITTIISARILGPNAFGILTYALSLVGIFAIFSSLGIELTLFKELTANKERREEILGSALVLRLITGILGCLGVIGMLFFIHEDPYIEMIIFLLSFSLITQTLPLLGYDFLKDSEAKYTAITQVITMVISNLLKIGVIYFYQSLAIFAIILVCENIFSGMLYALQIRTIKKRTLRFTFSKDYAKLLLSFSLPLVFFSAFSEIYARIDQIMLRHYLDITAVGLYGVSVRLTEIWYVIPNIVIGGVFAALVHSHENKEEYTKRLNLLMKFLLLLSSVITLVIFFLREEIVTLIYGKEFIAAASILGIYIFSLVGSFTSFLIYQDLFLNKRLFAMVFIPFITAAINIILNIYLIPLKGSAGAALATVISYSLIPILYFLMKKNRHAA